MIAKPMKTLELHYPMIQFLIINNIKIFCKTFYVHKAIFFLHICTLVFFCMLNLIFVHNYFCCMLKSIYILVFLFTGKQEQLQVIILDYYWYTYINVCNVFVCV